MLPRGGTGERIPKYRHRVDGEGPSVPYQVVWTSSVGGGQHTEGFKKALTHFHVEPPSAGSGVTICRAGTSV